MTSRRQPVTAPVGIALVLALIGVELTLLVAGIRDGQIAWRLHLVVQLLPWAIANLVSGLLLLPAAWLLHRRRIAELVRTRRISDVIRQTRIEAARKRAADAVSAARIGVTVHPATGKITGTRKGLVTAPHTTPAGRHSRS
ncbi:hypothetical protein GCM10025881_15660 [Pseudolysinimonas kribbensis]|uniref:Uncharacterized protein n=1 Tax=Pseudolysinimonas kribbensis TaxID=433641 RepID=A0ABQ6K7H7_9MICO|nr:hypothetical protein [Pseudolysinimonas kribbensis]GMA94742.1 hypothetical protein GCM10025881_15660 [Pseudolysinimonas kribbensis]